MLTLDPASRLPLYLQIADRVREAVEGGRLTPGDPLPSIRELSTRLQVSPNTVVQAYRELVREGVAQVRRGRGTFVAAPPSASAAQQRRGEAVIRTMLAEAARHGLRAEEIRALVDRQLRDLGRGPPSVD